MLTAAARVRAAPWRARTDEHDAMVTFEQARPGQRLGQLPAVDQRGKLVQVLLADPALGRVPGGQRQAGHARAPPTPRLAIPPLAGETGDPSRGGLHAGDGPVLDPQGVASGEDSPGPHQHQLARDLRRADRRIIGR